MNIVILSGFLGAGKTSLLLQLAGHLTGNASYSRTKVAILENEIGRVSVDGPTLRSQGIEFRELFSGCICCTLTGELASTLREIEEKEAPDWLIIEATGLAYPNKTADVVREYIHLLDSLHIIVLVDAEHFLMLDKIMPLISGQPLYADLLLLNKIDLVDDETRKQTIERLHEINATAPLFEIVATNPIPDELIQEMLR
jgi:G3E family GTPase